MVNAGSKTEAHVGLGHVSWDSLWDALRGCVRSRVRSCAGVCGAKLLKIALAAGSCSKWNNMNTGEMERNMDGDPEWPSLCHFRSSHAFGTGMIQMFIERPSGESMADWIWILVPSGLIVGCGWSAAVVLWPVERSIISLLRRSMR